jgi:peptidyl-prolyl cis-trans isomerase B (cyclophilin B)
VGGVPRLDGTYTVFGEVTEGLDVVDKIAAVMTDNSDRPVSDIRILKMKIIDK